MKIFSAMGLILLPPFEYKTEICGAVRKPSCDKGLATGTNMYIWKNLYIHRIGEYDVFSGTKWIGGNQLWSHWCATKSIFFFFIYLFHFDCICVRRKKKQFSIFFQHRRLIDFFLRLFFQFLLLLYFKNDTIALFQTF